MESKTADVPRWVRWAATFLFVAQLFDLWSTLFMLGRGGYELNPVMRWLIEKDVLWFIGIKLVMAGFCSWYPVSAWRRMEKSLSNRIALALALAALCLMYASVIVNNGLSVLAALR
jgi:hypothetical protein